jgi:hypothetical protein
VALGIVGGLTHMRCVEILEVAAISLFVGCLFLYGGCSTCDDALGEQLPESHGPTLVFV